MSIRELADSVLEAFAHSDLEATERLCTEDAVVFGTDAGEVWHDRSSLVAALDGMRELGLEARWLEEPVRGTHWVAGAAEFVLSDGSTLPVRVSMVFAGDRLVHAHYSVAVA
ncbi:MAG: nuclear transport factor 2 family protein [Gaiellaceae bacterium]